ncbi:MAG: adenosylmethionine decarboxylase [Sulfolobales archaeon]|nr:adenosylmethionine decarboxylase [Sulfolobales archaeon]MDW8082194.1 adenosylmethionine decarboxylase [Sulfolobales archaeon]
MREVRYLVYGKHVYGSLYGCKYDLLADQEFLKKVVVDAARVGNMTLLEVKTWLISPGVSVVAIILESHIAIHTWPEYEFATVDVYSCGKHSKPEEAFKYIVQLLNPKRFEYTVTDRSYLE